MLELSGIGCLVLVRSHHGLYLNDVVIHEIDFELHIYRCTRCLHDLRSNNAWHGRLRIDNWYRNALKNRLRYDQRLLLLLPLRTEVVLLLLNRIERKDIRFDISRVIAQVEQNTNSSDELRKFSLLLILFLPMLLVLRPLVITLCIPDLPFF